MRTKTTLTAIVAGLALLITAADASAYGAVYVRGGYRYGYGGAAVVRPGFGYGYGYGGVYRPYGYGYPYAVPTYPVLPYVTPVPVPVPTPVYPNYYYAPSYYSTYGYIR